MPLLCPARKERRRRLLLTWPKIVSLNGRSPLEFLNFKITIFKCIECIVLVGFFESDPTSLSRCFYIIFLSSMSYYIFNDCSI